MQLVTFKLQEGIIKRIEEILKPMHFNNRTEFIREAIREKLNRIDTEIFMQRIARVKGTSKSNTSDKELRRIRREVGDAYIKSLEAKFK